MLIKSLIKLVIQDIISTHKYCMDVGKGERRGPICASTNIPEGKMFLLVRNMLAL